MSASLCRDYSDSRTSPGIQFLEDDALSVEGYDGLLVRFYPTFISTFLAIVASRNPFIVQRAPVSVKHSPVAPSPLKRHPTLETVAGVAFADCSIVMIPIHTRPRLGPMARYIALIKEIRFGARTRRTRGSVRAGRTWRTIRTRRLGRT